MRLGIAAVLLGALVLALTPAFASTSTPATGSAVVAPDGVLGHAGRWVVDAQGRVVIVHGVNVPSKTLPAYPAAIGFGDDDAQVLAASGFNAVRLTVERYAVEPSPGHFDDAYIAQIGQTVSLLDRYGIVSLIDFHQDEFGPVFHDNGFPAWMTETDGLPNLYQVGFPEQYLLNPALNAAFDHFWSDVSLQDDDVAILTHVVRQLAGLPGLLGYEILNEPWPGAVYPTCAVLLVGCPLFDRGPLSAYYARMIPALRAADPAHLIWYEPLVLFNYGIPTSVVTPPDPRLGFAFHDYGLCSVSTSFGSACAPEDQLVIDNALARSASTGQALLETEFGATTDVATLQKQLGQYDQGMIPWMFWSYTSYIDPTGANGALLPATASNINSTMLGVLARPYPQLISGTPVSWSFDPSSKAFSFAYTPRRADGHGSFPSGAESDISVPAVQYPHGYRVVVRGGSVVSAPGSPVLRIDASAPAVSVALSPA